jgi:hypothetical protein
MNLEVYLTKQGIEAKLIHLGTQTTTARMAAEALGVPIEADQTGRHHSPQQCRDL